MTVEELKAYPKPWIGTKETSELLQVPRYGLNLAAKEGKLGLEYAFSGNRLKISKASVLKFLGVEPEERTRQIFAAGE